MARGIAIGIAESLRIRRTSGAGFGKAPGGVEHLADAVGVDQHVRLGGGAKPGREAFEAKEIAPCVAGVDHRAAHEITRGAGHGEQCR